MNHDMVVVDGDTVGCRQCRTVWDTPRPAVTPCPTPSCPGDGDGRRPHHFGADGHCHFCGDVDRG